MPATQIYVRPNTEIDNKLKETFADNKDSKVILLLESSTDIETGDSWDESCCKGEWLILLNSPYFSWKHAGASAWQGSRIDYVHDGRGRKQGCVSLKRCFW